MIITITLNFALDVTYHVPAIHYGETVRVPHVGRRAGGKGVNCARVLQTLGHEAVVMGFAGGWPGRAARQELAEAGLVDETVGIDAESRLTFMVVDGAGAATGFSELGPTITARDWAALRERYVPLLREARAVIVAGSVPPGVPPDGCGQLVALAVEAGVPVVLDTDGDQLAQGVRAGPDLVKINRAELLAVVGGEDVAAGAAELCRAGARSAVISSGAEGMLCISPGAPPLRAAPPRSISGNPTGAGDAASASLAVALATGGPWPEALADACALSAASVAAPWAGSFDAGLYRELRAQIVTRPVPPA